MKRSVIRILTGALLFAVCAILPVEGVWRLLLFLVPYLIIGGDVLWRAVRNILRGSVFDENFLMSIATVGAFCLRDYSCLLYTSFPCPREIRTDRYSSCVTWVLQFYAVPLPTPLIWQNRSMKMCIRDRRSIIKISLPVT